jgi:hypothetical protein
MTSVLLTTPRLNALVKVGLRMAASKVRRY